MLCYHDNAIRVQERNNIYMCYLCASLPVCVWSLYIASSLEEKGCIPISTKYEKKTPGRIICKPVKIGHLDNKPKYGVRGQSNIFIQ